MIKFSRKIKFSYPKLDYFQNKDNNDLILKKIKYYKNKDNYDSKYYDGYKMRYYNNLKYE